ncbi:MAG: 30S ribosomal protein S21 [Candidatus Andersenbacteria bacterium]|nr:30S ribosomal protein S21 [Candidatus Andersenbacteria bacterium]MBI3251020.1 30S ribosomal protein S21 [Candidatus Andersenbacteria bacterium]
MVEVRKRDNESTESLIRRFSRKVQASGVLLQAKKVRYYQRKKSKLKAREEAKRKSELLAEREKLIKLGLLEEYTTPGFRRSRR